MSGVRERNKQDKRDRLIRASRELFSEQGFDATTIRQIAARSGLGVGTVFLYAQDKRGLLFLLFSDAVQAIQAQAFASLDTLAPSAQGPGQAKPMVLVDQMMHVFSRFYRYYADDRALARLYIKELLFMDKPPADAAPEDESGPRHALTMDFIARLAGLVGAAQGRGELRPDCDPVATALNFFSIYFVTLLGLLDPQHGVHLSADQACDRLRAALTLQFDGLRIPAVSTSATSVTHSNAADNKPAPSASRRRTGGGRSAS